MLNGPSEDTRTIGSRWLALLALCAGVLMTVLDSTIVNVALPAIRADLQLNSSALVWVVNAYMLSFGGSLIVVGRLGDVYGNRRMYLSGIGLFTAASLTCGVARTAIFLVIARAVQGLGAAMVVSIALSLIVNLFPEARQRGKALSVYAFVSAAGGSVGLLLGGALTGALSWRWIFFINLPVGVWVWACCASLLPGETSIATRTPQLLVPTAIFRLRTFAWSNFLYVLWAAGMSTWFFLCVLYLQASLGNDPMRISLAFLPMTLITAVVALTFAARLVARFGVQPLLGTGLLLGATGLALLACGPAPVSLVSVAPSMSLIGLGTGIALNPLLQYGMREVGPEESGLASGILSTARLLGGALGLAILSNVASAHTQKLVESGVAPSQALINGYQFALLVAAGCVGLAAFTAYLCARASGPDSSTVASAVLKWSAANSALVGAARGSERGE